MKSKYYYPVLSDKDLGWFRIGGPGLANCMFFSVNAYISACKHARGGFVAPTWRKFSLGPIFTTVQRNYPIGSVDLNRNHSSDVLV